MKKDLKRLWAFVCAAALMVGLFAIIPEPVALAGNTGSVNMPQTIAAGENYSAAITKDGELMVWGANYSGNLGVESDGNYVIEPTKKMDNVVSVYASNEISVPLFAAITEDGKLWTWGINDFGQLGNGNTTNKLVDMGP